MPGPIVFPSIIPRPIMFPLIMETLSIGREDSNVITGEPEAFSEINEARHASMIPWKHSFFIASPSPCMTCHAPFALVR